MVFCPLDPRRFVDRVSGWLQHRGPDADVVVSCRVRLARNVEGYPFVQRLEAEEKTAGGIIIPDTAKEKPQEGEIIAVGTGARKDNGEIVALDVKAGDRVLFGKWSGTEVKIDGEDLLIMKESDIMGVIA